MENRCGNLEFVPFLQHPLGASYVPSFSEDTEEPLDPLDTGSIYYDIKTLDRVGSSSQNRHDHDHHVAESTLSSTIVLPNRIAAENEASPIQAIRHEEEIHIHRGSRGALSGAILLVVAFCFLFLPFIIKRVELSKRSTWITAGALQGERCDRNPNSGGIVDSYYAASKTV